MAGDIRTIVEAIADRLEALGYKQASAVFDFDAVPDSTIDKTFRIETRLIDVAYSLDGQAQAVEMVDVYVAYKVNRSPVSAWAKAIDEREDIEAGVIGDATIAALDQDPILALANESAEMNYLGNYLVSKVSFRCDYIRYLTA